MAQVVGVAVEKALLLNEVDEHQAVEHQRRVPFKVRRRLDALDELHEGGVFGLETFVEFLGDFIDVEGRFGFARHVEQRELIFLLHPDGDLFEPLDERIARLRAIEAMVAAGERFARFAADPLPNLLARWPIGIDHEMLTGTFGDLLVDFQANRALGNRGANVSRKPSLLSDRRQSERGAVDRHLEMGLVIVPPQLLAEESGKIERL